MRTCHVVDTLDHHPGLPSVFLPGLLTALEQRGVECRVIAGASHDALMKSPTHREDTIMVEEDDPGGSMAAIAPAVKHADIVHLHTEHTDVATFAAAAARGVKTPFIVSPYGSLLKRLLGRGRLARWFEKRRFGKKFRGARSIHCFCQGERAQLGRYGFGQPTTVLPIGYSVHPTALQAELESLEPLQLPWSDDLRVLAYFGDIDGRVGLKQLLRAAHRLSAEMTEWRLIIAGRPIDNWLEKFQTGMRRWSAEQLCDFVVYPDLAQQTAILDAAELVVTPAITPAPPTSALWAMSAGRPVVVSAASGLSANDLKGAGELVDASSEGLASGLTRMMGKGPAELRAMGEVARRVVQRSFDWTTIVDRYVAAYRRCLS